MGSFVLQHAFCSVDEFVILIACRLCEFDKLSYLCVLISNDIITLPYVILYFIVSGVYVWWVWVVWYISYAWNLHAQCHMWLHGLSKLSLTFQVLRIAARWQWTLRLAINPLKPELNPICYLLALLGAHYFLHVSRIRVKLLTRRWLMSYIYGASILDVSRSHTTTQQSR